MTDRFDMGYDPGQWPAQPIKQRAPMIDHSIELERIVRLTCIALLVTLGMSWRLYVRGERLFLPTPILPVLLRVPLAADLWILRAELGLLVWVMIRPRSPVILSAILAILVFWALQDLMRLHTYMMMYAFTLAAWTALIGLKQDAWAALRAMVICVYLWAGLNKLNFAFLFVVVPWFLHPLFPFLADDPAHKGLAPVFGVSVALFEASIGVLLFWPATRKLASLMALVMLLTVLFCLGPLGRNVNFIVLPWNIYLAGLELILFLNQRDRLDFTINRRRNGAMAVGLFVFGAAPFLGLLGYWSAFPSIRLYSGNTPQAEIVFAKDEDVAALPHGLGALVTENHHLNLNTWTLYESNTAPYLESSVFVSGAKGLCPYLKESRFDELVIDMPADFWSRRFHIQELPLCP